MADNMDDMPDSMGDMQDAGQNESVDFYTGEVARYESMVNNDFNDSLQRYGFTLFHSLPALKQVELREKLGFTTRDAIDFYNLAGLDISKEDYPSAISKLQKSLELDGSMADAAYNLAICYEKVEKKSDAINQWSRFIELSEDDEAKALVEVHLAELNS